jgi:hypothetical protein
MTKSQTNSSRFLRIYLISSHSHLWLRRYLVIKSAPAGHPLMATGAETAHRYEFQALQFLEVELTESTRADSAVFQPGIRDLIKENRYAICQSPQLGTEVRCGALKNTLHTDWWQNQLLNLSRIFEREMKRQAGRGCQGRGFGGNASAGAQEMVFPQLRRA